MNITRNNYEEFLMLYADNELAAAERKEVEVFIAANPDLQHELAMFQQFKLSPDASVVFTGKEALMKQETGGVMISMANYESFFVLYADDELSNSQKAAVENFVYRYPHLQEAFELLHLVRLSPDKSIVFENKPSLYRKEEDDKVAPFRWWRLAVAAMILLLAGIFWLYRVNKNDRVNFVQINQPGTIIKQDPSLQKNAGTPAIKNSGNEQPANQVARATGTEKEHRPAKNTLSSQNAVVSNKKERIRGNNKVQPRQDTAIKDEGIVSNDKDLKRAAVSTAYKPVDKAEMKNVAIAAANKPLTDQQVTLLHPDENNEAKAEQALYVNDEKVEVLNTSFSKKNSLKGFLRKASRIIAKKTSSENEDGNRKAILIGGFEIAVR